MGTPVTTKTNPTDDQLPVNDEKDFTVGENRQLPESLTAAVDPKIAAELFLEHRATSTKAGVESTVAFSEGVAAFKDDRTKLQEFLERLAKAKVLSSEEVEAGLGEKKSKSFISKLNKIQAYSSVFLDERVIGLLNPGYSVLYEVALLYEVLQEKVEEGETPLDVILGMMESCDGPINRNWLKSERSKLKPPRVDAPSIVPEPDASAADDLQGEKPEKADHTAESASHSRDEAREPESPRGEILDRPTIEDQSQETSMPFAAVLMTVRGKEASRLRELLDGDRLPACVNLSDQIAKNGVLIVHAELDVLLSLTDVVHRLGFDRCSNVYLLDKAEVPDVTSKSALAVYERGAFALSGNPVEWSQGNDPRGIADSLLEGFNGRRLHVFAEGHSDGWEALIGEENWQTGQ